MVIHTHRGSYTAIFLANAKAKPICYKPVKAPVMLALYRIY